MRPRGETTISWILVSLDRDRPRRGGRRHRCRGGRDRWGGSCRRCWEKRIQELFSIACFSFKSFRGCSHQKLSGTYGSTTSAQHSMPSLLRACQQKDLFGSPISPKKIALAEISYLILAKLMSSVTTASASQGSTPPKTCYEPVGISHCSSRIFEGCRHQNRSGKPGSSASG